MAPISFIRLACNHTDTGDQDADKNYKKTCTARSFWGDFLSMKINKLSIVKTFLFAGLLAGFALIPWTASFAGEGEDSDEPMYVIDDQGRVDFGSYNGYRRFNGECNRCHGFDGEGGFAPSLLDSLKVISYDDFVDIVVNGRVQGTAVMPPFGQNADIMEYMDDIYVYLKGRSDGVIGVGRPKRVPKTLD